MNCTLSRFVMFIQEFKNHYDGSKGNIKKLKIDFPGIIEVVKKCKS